MLPSKIPQARVLTYDWNANYAEDASADRFLGHANALLHRLQLDRRVNVWYLFLLLIQIDDYRTDTTPLGPIRTSSRLHCFLFWRTTLS